MIDLIERSFVLLWRNWDLIIPRFICSCNASPLSLTSSYLTMKWVAPTRDSLRRPIISLYLHLLWRNVLCKETRYLFISSSSVGKCSLASAKKKNASKWYDGRVKSFQKQSKDKPPSFRWWCYVLHQDGSTKMFYTHGNPTELWESFGSDDQCG